ncbi:MAG: GAF domain-containing protein [Deltaproteobacteria bacterium]|nr:GAF domain-containing protein [Deltaproteobacteria bacterium]
MRSTVTDVSQRTIDEQEIEVAADPQRVIVEIGAAGLAGTALPELAQMAASRLAASLDVECTAVLEFLPGTDELLLRAGVGWKEGLVGNAKIGGATGFLAEPTLRSDRPVVTADLATGQRFTGEPLFIDHGLVSGIDAAIGAADGSFGVLAAYTAKPRHFGDDEVCFLQAVAAVLANVIAARRAQQESLNLNRALERRLEDTLAELRSAVEDFEAFSGAISHDLRQPLHTAGGFVGLLQAEAAERLDASGRDYLAFARAGINRMGRMIDDLLRLSRVGRAALQRSRMSLSDLAQEIVAELRARDPDRRVAVEVQQDLVGLADAGLVSVLMHNLLGNAWKFTSKTENARIQFGGATDAGGGIVYFVKDNGSGFDMTSAQRLFLPFQRLHAEEEFGGAGMGLATVARIARRHGGLVWAEGALGEGATFYFSLGARTEPSEGGGNSPELR